MQVLEELQKKLQVADHIAISMDEASAIGHTAWLSIHVYYVVKGIRYVCNTVARCFAHESVC